MRPLSSHMVFPAAAFVLLCAVSVIGAQPPEDAIVFYVATTGNDQWSGKLAEPNAAKTDGPFAGITRARDAIRGLKAAGALDRPVTVRIRGGTYYVLDTIVLTPEDSGTEQAPVTYAAYPGEKPVLCGGRPITGLKPDGGGTVSVVLPEVKSGEWYFRQLFVGDERQVRAREPDFDPSDPYRGGFWYVYKHAQGFGSAVGNIHNPGDWMEYKVRAPAAGEYLFWTYYGAQNAPFGTTDMGGRTVVTVDGGEPVALMNLPDTAGWSVFAWSHSATLTLTAGEHVLRWQNVKGGGLNLEAFALSDDPDWAPEGTELTDPAPGRHVVLIQAEDFAASHGPQLSVSVGGGDKHEFRCEPGTVKKAWADVPDPEVHIFPSDCCRAFKEIVRLEAVDEATGTVTVGGPECVALLRMGDRYFVENVPDALDSPGEWYLDRDSGVLRYRPPKPLAGDTEIIAPVVGRVFEFRSDPEGAGPVSHLRLSGLTVKNTDYSPDDGCVGFQMGKDGAVYLSGAQACVVEGCEFLNTGKYAVCLAGGKGNSVLGNDIAHGGEGGVLLLDSAGNTVSDNYIHHCGEIYKHIGGVVLQGPGASDNVISHNLIHTMSRYGITLKNAGSRNTVQYNELYDLNTETYDTGGIEVTQHDKEFRSGSLIDHNIVRDVIGYSCTNGQPVYLSWGIYLDSYAGGYTVTNNIVYRNSHGGLMVQGGKDNVIENNVFVDSTGSQLYFPNFQGNTTGTVFRRNIVYYTNPDAVVMATGSVSPEMMTADHNLYFLAGGGELKARGAGMATFEDWRKLGFDEDSPVADPLFVDPAADNYALKPQSPAFGLGFQAIDTTKIGLLRKRPAG